jgi:tRNA-guanine family transglycosylase
MGRHVMGLGMPEEVLLCVEHGVDLLDSIYPYTLTCMGFGMTFEADVLREGYAAATAPVEPKVNLRSLSYMCALTALALKPKGRK